ncbi:hypothetical protein ACEWY4_016105 [Coilia grayii]|uniref:Gypsy retrotransposon integrase-like protein 1 n=1 Tax=Coilia grayii TaxID=363190 RepID=A0ABD1JQU6_9TELE
MAYRHLTRKAMLEQPVDESEGGAAGGEPEVSPREEPDTPDLNALYQLIRKSLQTQERESYKQEQRWRSVQIQMNQFRDDLEAERRGASDGGQHRVEQWADDDGEQRQARGPHPPALEEQRAAPRMLAAEPPGASPVAWTRAAVPKLEESDDIEQYLTTFERLAVAYRWPQADWAVYLVPYLTGRARAAYVAMDIVEAMDYDKVKEAILAKYEINEDIYRERFRDPDIRPGETPRELYHRLKDLYRKWIKPAGKTVEDIGEMIILEQYLRSLAPDVRVWVKEHSPASGQQAAEWVEAFLSARRGPKTFRFQRVSRPAAGSKAGGFGSGVGPNVSGQSRATDTKTHIFSPTTHPRPATAPTSTPPRGPVICHFCRQAGHIARNCPVRVAKGTGMCGLPRPGGEQAECHGKVQTTPVVVNGRSTVALLDTGSSQSLVQPHLVEPYEALGERKLRVCCVNGDEHTYPVADICVEVGGQAYRLTAGVVRGLSHPVVLGQDVLILPELVQASKPVSMVVTRAQAKARAEETPEQAVNKSLLDMMPYSEAELDAPKQPKVLKTRRQRRREKLLGTVQKMPVQGVGPDDQGAGLWEIPSNFSTLQRDDNTLREAYKKVTEIEGEKTGAAKALTGEYYFIREGLLYHQPEGGSAEQLVVPQGLRAKVLALGHDIPWAGHLGSVKTLERVAARFHWPGLYTDVQQYCKSCPTCQLSSSYKVRPSPLKSLPIIGTPFHRIGVDIVGPLERTRSGHRFILVVCDYATRYPEAFPLRKVTAGAIARTLLQLFSRVGLPQEVLTDQGTAFLSKTLKQMYSLLGIKSIRTTPYHPQTDGLVERYNRTLKGMLRKFVAANGKDWDQWLPYLLFAYREVPQASTGFSPFELLYGRQVRGPLDLLREAWEQPPPAGGSSVIAYVLKMRDKMEELASLVKDNLAQAQRTQAQWYDQTARQRTLQPGQKVLLLLPTTENKLLARWQGPYRVCRQLGPVTYEIEMPERRKAKQVFHVNLLKEWHERDLPLSHQLLVRAVVEDEPAEQFFPSRAASAELDFSHLTPQQQRELQAIIPEGLFQDQPGRTTLVEHDILLKDTTPVRQRMYRIPERLMPALQEELEVMQRLGVIERSNSSWSSPVVLVPKKDGSLRFCIDFRQVNAQSQFDAYPMPRLEDLIERLGKAQYITTLDLCKGYWQVTMAEGARPLTAFRTPQGLFQFTVMPFGLQGAPASFQRLMDQVLDGTGAFAVAYLDDIAVYSATWGQHLEHLGEVLHRLHQAGLTVQPKKCALAHREVRYLGHVLGCGVIRPQKDKVDAIRGCARPQTKKDVRSFLGLAGWYRRFIPNFASRAAPLTDLTRKSGSNCVQWEEVHEQAFQDLKGALLCEPVLQSPDFDRHFTVQTDASGVGLGAVLLQGEADEQKPVAYVSRKLFPRETRYSVVELECLAVKWALDTLKYYLLGREFTLETDHRALQWLGKMKDSNARVTRWFLSLQPFRFVVKYRAGKQNPVADFLSRHPRDESSEGGGNVKSVNTF